jgi:hypothetical protein
MPNDPLQEPSERLAHRVAASMTRKSFLGRAGAAVFAIIGLPLLASSAAESTDGAAIPGTNPVGSWFGFCGHYWTTGACPGPTTVPRVDAHGYPVHPATGNPIDNNGRPVSAEGRPVDDHGNVLTAPDGLPLAPTPRTRLCEGWAASRYGLNAAVQGSWYRCCDGTVRRLSDCCSTSPRRINGDAGLEGYCHPGRTVFCFVYSETGVPC